MQRTERVTERTIRSLLDELSPELLPTQQTLCIPIINRIFQKMNNGLWFDDIRVYENLVIDGHHRYVASHLAKQSLGSVPSHRTSATTAYSWQDVEFVEEEWDTRERIERLNKEDAAFNNIPLADLETLTG